MDFWEKLGNADDEVEDTDWDEIHIRNFKFSIDTRLRSFSNLNIFTNQLPLMIFLFKSNCRNSRNCDFCDRFPESMLHIFYECDFMLDPFGNSCSGLLKINMIFIFQLQILIRFLEFLETNSWLIYFCA